MTEELPPGLEAWVFAMTKGAFKSREVLEAERPEDVPPYSDDLVLLQNWGTLINRQGTILAHLSMVPATRAELKESMPGLLDRSPAWLDARLQGKPLMSWDLFFRVLAWPVSSKANQRGRPRERGCLSAFGSPSSVDVPMS